MTARECAERQEQWKDRVEDFRTSGLSGRQWCAQRGLKVNQVHYWTRKFPATDADVAAATWVALDTPGPHGDRSAEALVVSVGPVAITVRPGFDAAFLQSLVRALATC